jgi:hypothetical protein
MWLSTELLRLKTNSLDLVITKTYRKTISFSSDHSFFDPNIPLLLHIEMLLCSQTLRQLIDQIKNSLIDNNYRVISFLSLTSLCSKHLKAFHICINIISFTEIRKPANIIMTDGSGNRFVKIADFELSTFH